MRTAVACLSTLLLPSLAYAHHSFAEFDQRQTIEISGTLSEVAWQNPHVRLKVQTADAGKPVTWDIECHSVGILSRSSLDPKALKVGDKVKVAGNPSKVSPVRMFATNVLLSSGTELMIQPGVKPHWNTSATSVFAQGTPSSAPAAPATTGLFKVWSSALGSVRDPEATPFSLWSREMPLTPAARKARAAWDPVHQTITKGCDPKGMPTIMEQPYGMQFEDHGSTIVLRLEEYDTVRTIHMSDGGKPPTRKSLLGYSVGKWDGTSLVITTTGVSWLYITAGVPQGPSSRMEERFTPAADGRRLAYTITITDPDTFTEPAVLKRAWVWLENESVKRYACGKPQSTAAK